MLHERVRNLPGPPLTGADKESSDLGLAKLELTDYDTKNPLNNPPIPAKLVARVSKIREQYLTSEVWATFRKSIDTALDKNKDVDKVVALKFGTLAHVADATDGDVEKYIQRLGSVFGIADQISARRGGGNGAAIFGASDVQTIFYDHQFYPGDERLLTGLGAKVVEYPEITTFIDKNALVIDNLLDQTLQLEFVVQSNPGILIGGRMERWAGDVELNLLVKNYPGESKGKVRAEALTFLKHRHVAPLSNVAIPEIRTAYEQANEPYEPQDISVYGQKGARTIYWLDPATNAETRGLGEIGKAVAAVEQEDADTKALYDAEFDEGYPGVVGEEKQGRCGRDGQARGIEKVTLWIRGKLDKLSVGGRSSSAKAK